MAPTTVVQTSGVGNATKLCPITTITAPAVHATARDGGALGHESPNPPRGASKLSERCLQRGVLESTSSMACRILADGLPYPR